MAQPTLTPEPTDTAPPTARCANCGAVLVGPFCAQCGQRVGPRIISVREILADTLEDQFSWNAALPRTLGALVLRPGVLTREYTGGRMARYIPPMRLYLAASLLFFLVLSFVATPEHVAGRRKAQPTIRVQTVGHLSPVRAGVVRSDTARSSGALIQVDTAFGPGWLQKRMRAQDRRLAGMTDEEVQQTLLAGLLNAAPKVAFLLLPVFALILKLLYLRRRRLYIEHFVFALHAQTIAFLMFTIMLVVPRAVSGWVNSALALGFAGYTYQAMRVVYGQGWFRTLLKFGIVAWTYSIAVVLGAGLGALITFLTV